MNIQPVNQQMPQTNFKATYPVKIWIHDYGKYIPITSDMKLVEQLQKKIVRILNKPSSNAKMSELEDKLRSVAGYLDIDYRNNPQVRSFYNRTNGDVKNGTWPSFIISGKHVEDFNKKYAKAIGKSKRDDKELFENVRSLNTDAAVDLYNSGGYNYVTSRMISYQGEPYGLGVIFEPMKNKDGNYKKKNGEKVYDMVKFKFMPEKQLRNR